MRQPLGRRTDIQKGPLIVILILALVVPVLAAKERKGARIETRTRDGLVIKGELLAVKGANLIIREKSTSNQVIASLLEIKTVKVVDKMSKKVTWGIVGALAGAALGFAVGPKGEPNPDSSALIVDQKSAAVYGALICGAAGWFIGDDDIKIKKSDPEYIAKISARLRKHARDPT